jgi:DNA-binding HxlR family transcriptional regulator
MSSQTTDNRSRPPLGVAPAYWMVRSNLVNRVIDIVGDTWILQILSVLMTAPHRFDQIVAKINIPRSTLAARLRQLSAAGCITWEMGSPRGRQPDDSGYSLTPKGYGLLPFLQLIHQWNVHWRVRGLILNGPPIVNPCGHAAGVQVECACCGGETAARDMKVLQTSMQPVEAPLPSAKRVRTLDIFSKNTEAIPAEVVLGDRWAGLIMASAFFRATKYSDIEAALGIAPNILAARLDRLTKQHLLVRRRYRNNPKRYAYHLTEKGLSLYPIIVAMVAWAQEWISPGADLGWRVLHKRCLEWYVARFRCAQCGAEIEQPKLPGFDAPTLPAVATLSSALRSAPAVQVALRK